ncbi:Z1 domain-containing protein [Bacteroidota bacterium]
MTERIKKRIGTAFSYFYNSIQNGLIKEDEISNLCNQIYATFSEEEKSQIDLESFIKEVKKQFEKQEQPDSIKDYNLKSWIQAAWRKSDKIHWQSYVDYLVSEDQANIIPKIDLETKEILDSCKNPEDDDNSYWDRRGLVYGHVQSGKTANYIGLINKAFDTGYRHVIVFTGMTEDLRQQTQERIDEGVTGRNMNNVAIGVGRFRSGGYNIRSATNINLDLSRGAIDHLQNNLLYKDRSIWVVKKNKTVLEHLIKWLDSQRNHQGNDKIKGAPFLIIDDEADNASIQSLSKKDFDTLVGGIEVRDQEESELSEKDEKKLQKAKDREIKTINRYIRVILSLIGQKTFVAYTATPYSIINQAPDDVEHRTEVAGKSYIIEKDSDLFPEHFIIPIKPGEGYMGLLNMFNADEEEKIPVLIDITNKDLYSEDLLNDSLDHYFPRNRGSVYDFDEIPKSMKEAIVHFILSIHVRNFRGHRNYNSMLIHTSHLTIKTDYLAWKVDEFVNYLRDSVIQKNEYVLKIFREKLSSIQGNSKHPVLNKYYETINYQTPDNITFEDIISILDSTYSNFEVVSYHSSTRNPDLKHHYHDLSYKAISEQNNPKNYIVIGGNRLSRGLTLKGLTTSYFGRYSSRQDSLYQMGRWFGYRNGYEDCVKIFMPGDQIDWFQDISILEGSLRNDLKQMNEPGIGNRILPRDWVIKLANSKSLASLQNRIQVCDPQKLRHTQRQRLSFSGAVEKTLVYKKKDEVHKYNFSLIQKLFDQLYRDKKVEKKFNYDLGTSEGPSRHNLNFQNIDPEIVSEFLRDFNFHEKYESTFRTAASFIDKNKSLFHSFSVVLKQIEKGQEIDMYGPWFVGETRIKAIERGDLNINNPSKDYEIGSILDRDKDNTFDILDPSNIQHYINLKGPEKTSYRNKERDKSKKGLLIIYPIKGKAETTTIIPAIHLIIPQINNGEKVTYIIRRRYHRI